jgi:hypothetical protein
MKRKLRKKTKKSLLSNLRKIKRSMIPKRRRMRMKRS